jgi:phage-related baseplate assembly protein
MKDGTIAGEEIKNAVYNACNPDEVRPLTDYVVVGDPEIVSYNIDFTYYIPSKTPLSSADIEAAVKVAADDYIAWQCGRLGRDINPDELRRRVLTAGIKRVVMNAPVFTVLRE